MIIKPYTTFYLYPSLKRWITTLPSAIHQTPQSLFTILTKWCGITFKLLQASLFPKTILEEGLNVSSNYP